MSTQQYSAAGRDGYTAGRDIYINHPTPTPDGSAYETESPDDSGVPSVSTGSGGLGGAGWIIAAVALLCFLGWVFSGSSSPAAGNAETSFPSKSAAWPAQATSAAVLAPVTAWLAACAREVVLSPVHCPQAASAGTDQVSAVRWSLHGNAGDGAVIRYSQGKFWVLGHAVITVTYSDSGPQWQVDTFGYEATVSWDNGHPAVASPPQAVSLDSGPSVVKHDPHVPMAEASALVMAGFKRCAALTVTPLPAQCMQIGEGGDQARWTLTGDPLLNATETFDPSTGLVHVTGNYAMTDSYHYLFGHQTGYLSGTYDAALSVDGAHATLLDISQGQ
jgi:hypothetical protein